MTMVDEVLPPATREQVSPLRVFLVFLRLGITAFGGPAMVAYIRNVVVIRKRWVSDGSFRDGAALCQSIPGATAMQAAAYCGYRAGGRMGAAAAYVGFGLPAFVLMTMFSAAYVPAQGVPVALSVFTGLRVIVVAIVANATVNFGTTSLKNARDVGMALAVAAFLGLGGHPILAIAMAAGAAVILYRDVITASGSHVIATDATPDGKLKSLVFPIAMILAVAATLATLFLTNRRLFDLASILLRIDLFAFGGGFASVPLMLHEVVDVRQWLDGKTFMDGIALGQVTPGPIVITATFVGYQVAGLLGAVVATLAIFTPSFVVLVLSVPYLDRLQRSAVFRRMLRGALVCFVGLLCAVTVRFALAAPWSVPSIIIAASAFGALRCKVDLLWVILAGGLVSAMAL